MEEKNVIEVTPTKTIGVTLTELVNYAYAAMHSYDNSNEWYINQTPKRLIEIELAIELAVQGFNNIPPDLEELEVKAHALSQIKNKKFLRPQPVE